MANMCSNFLFFIEGDEYNKKMFIQSFRNMGRNNNRTGFYQFPSEIEETPENYAQLTDFYIYEAEELVSFESRHTCPMELLKDMGKFYKISFECDYEEGPDYYGKLIYKYDSNESINVMLDDNDLSKYEYNEDEDKYFFKDKEYDSDTEILEILLTEKVKKVVN